MNDNAPACTRLLYIDTLSRFVGPFLRFGVVNFPNQGEQYPFEFIALRKRAKREGGGFAEELF